MAWVEIMLPSARRLPTGKLTQNPIRTRERRCIVYVGDDDFGTTQCGITRSISPSFSSLKSRSLGCIRSLLIGRSAGAPGLPRLRLGISPSGADGLRYAAREFAVTTSF